MVLLFLLIGFFIRVLLIQWSFNTIAPLFELPLLGGTEAIALTLLFTLLLPVKNSHVKIDIDELKKKIK